MLLGKDRRRYQICHLFAIIHRLERGADGHFRLTVSHITADQAVHDLPALHISFGIFYGMQLILCFLIREHLFKLFLPYTVLIVYISFFCLTDSI